MGGAPSPGLQRFLDAVGDALRRGDVGGAMATAEQAVALGLESPDLLLLAGQHRMRQGQFDRAFPVLQRAHAMAPDSVEALNGLGACLGMMGRPGEAVAMFDAAIARAPGRAYLHLHRAQALEDAGRLRAAQADLEAAVALEPENAAALGRLANLCARRGEMDAARRTATRALAHGPLPAGTIALAMAELADRNFAAAHALAEPLASEGGAGPLNRSIALGLLGDALDGLGKPAEAFAAYVEARDVLRDSFRTTFERDGSAIARVQRAAGYFRDAPPAPWRARPGAATPLHVFLVGFPRSGTTLLEQALASHPDVRTMEEIDCLGEVTGEYFFAADGLARFAALDETALEALRAAYWRAVEAHGIAADTKVFVDKMPLNSVHQGFIARLFPQAKILFALRDPRDVVLSCFRRRLVLSAQAYELSRLDGAAQFYDVVMTLAMLYRDTLGLPTLDLRHEDMIADFDGEMRRACDFLGVGWDARMRDFADHARARDVKTPSALQIVRGLNAEGAGQWRRFADQLEPILPILAPWAARFGYKEA
jgi:tetratricopeptide (TPR) repeat protein